MTALDTPRVMPSVDSVIAYWRAQEVKWLRAYYIGWGEPFCFACGWLPPVADGRKDSWTLAAKWLDRAHLHDRAAGGPDEPHNIAMLCHLCHEDYLDSDSVEQGIEWVNARPIRDPLWQMWTDALLHGVMPTRPTTLVRSRMKFLDFLLRHKLGAGEEPASS